VVGRQLTQLEALNRSTAAYSGGLGSGERRKTLLTESGPVELDTPRDRAGTFEPVIVRKGQLRWGVSRIDPQLSIKQQLPLEFCVR
jgi:transposase-like protein